MRARSRNPVSVLVSILLRSMLLHRGLGMSNLQLLDESRHVNGFDRGQIEYPASLAPVRESARCLVVGPPRVLIANVCREELPEALRCLRIRQKHSRKPDIQLRQRVSRPLCRDRLFRRLSDRPILAAKLACSPENRFRQGNLMTVWRRAVNSNSWCFHFETALQGRAPEKNRPDTAYPDLFGETSYSDACVFGP
jgi:hypothetical protein